MSLKRRNITAWILIFCAAVCWTLGQQMLDNAPSHGTVDPTSATVPTIPMSGPDITPSKPHNTTDSTSVPGTVPAIVWPTMPMTSPETVPSDQYDDTEPADDRTEKWAGWILSFAAVAAAVMEVFVLSQKTPIYGPDGVCLLFVILTALGRVVHNLESMFTAEAWAVISGTLKVFFILTSARELLGWLRSRCAGEWCLIHRIASRCALPRTSLLVFIGWILFSAAGAIYFAVGTINYVEIFLAPLISCLAAGASGFCWLWKYGSDLGHFQEQLSNYQKGLPVTVGEGAFAQTEAQLLDVQARHEEAVRAAVTSERFKVELISNVSHDLRTPLTAILGYSELLQKETLSPEGREQLRRLHQKAGYMNDLVESLFELTKVSSGVVESKKDEIDLVRLLEQTIGLFDDQLVSAGLTVRRSYASDTIPVLTDGARMHQVFANLLGNAIKYALAGTRIYLEVKETEDSYLVRMMNTASYEMDFKPEEIMQRFARGDKARSTKGSGLGLAIAQTYTESVGGSFRVAVDGDQFSAIVELPLGNSE